MNDSFSVETQRQKQIQILRSELRSQLRNQRNSLSAHFQAQCSQTIIQLLHQSPRINLAKNIALYLANDGELDLQPFIDWCWRNNIKTYLPVIHPFSKGNLLFIRFHQHSEMVTNRYGILEPKLNVKEVIPLFELDIIFTPLVGFDKQGERLGMGGGYYDRTLAAWYQNREKMNKPYPIGLAHDCQLVDQLPTASWDIPIPEIFTPSKHFQFF